MGALTKFAIFETHIFFETRCSWVKKRITDFRFFLRFYIFPLTNKVLCVLLGGEQALARQRLCGGSVGCWGGNKPWRGCWGKGSVWKGSEMSSKTFSGFVLRTRLLILQCSKTAFVWNELRLSEKKNYQFPFVHCFYIYHWMTKCSVCCWEADKLWRGK